MDGIATEIVARAMRTGYAARGLVYLLVGVITLSASIRGGPAAGLLGALRRLKDQPWNEPILISLAIGLALYALWRALDSIFDLAGHGRGFGWIERGGLFFVALLHVGFAFYAWRLATQGPEFASSSGGNIGQVIGAVLAHPYGRWLVILAGIGGSSMGIYSAWKGVGNRYRNHLRRTPLMERLVPVLAFGLLARGVVLVIMGGFIGWAGVALDPQAAGGFGHALAEIRTAWHGRVLLGIVGAGMIAFSGYCFIEASYRIIPTRITEELETLADVIEDKLEHGTS